MTDAGCGSGTRKLSVSGTFLQAPAHPDDETNALFTYFGYGQGLRVIDLQNNRGDSGQNEIGPELFQGLAVLRTAELLSAHRIDGAEQPEVPPDAALTNASVVHFVVTLNNPVTGVTAADFSPDVLSGAITGATISSVTPGGSTASSTFLVTVSGITGNGGLAIQLVDQPSVIEDVVSRPLSGPGSSAANPFLSQAFTIDQAPPTVASIVATDANPTNASVVHYTVTFSEIVVGVGVNDFSLVAGAGLSGASITSIVPDSATPSASYVVTVNTGTGSGTLGLNVANGAATIADLAGNSLSGNGSGSTVYVGPAYSIDRVPPRVASIVATDANLTNASVIHYTVTFTNFVFGVGLSDFSLVPGTGLSGASIASIVPGNTTPAASYVITVNTGAGSGSLRLNVANGAATIKDMVGNPLVRQRFGQHGLCRPGLHDRPHAAHGGVGRHHGR